AMPQYISTIEKARSGEAVANIGSLRTSLDRYWYQNAGATTAGATTSIPLLDIDDPNSVTNALYSYAITSNTSTASVRTYVITATRTAASGTIYTVSWRQVSNIEGQLYRSANLGGPVYTAPSE
ncbi:MAG: hypothetical protein HQ566_03825, partial [Candidatus Omnitrophica bacterium]|nr:hypothetical protein [Candidatus Omnitrophota bacterium]